MITNDELFLKYPKFLEELTFGIECGRGWNDILDKAIGEILALQSDVVASQIKEKFGGLRIYLSNVREESVYDVVDKYECIAARTCMECGKPGKLLRGGWMVTLCPKHTDEEMECRKSRLNSTPWKTVTN